MNDSLKAFLNSVAYHVDDVPLLAGSEAEDVLDEWKAEGIDVPDELTAPVLFLYHNDTLDERYPVTYEPLNPVLDRAIFRFLRGELYDFHDGTDEPITYVEAWFAVNEWRTDDETIVPDCLTPLTYMRYVNSHHAMRKYDKVWITYADEGEEHWVGPFRSISPNHIDAEGNMEYRACDAFEEDFPIIVPVSHEVTTRDDL